LQVTVVIKRHDECVGDRYVTYQAISPDPLPSTFDNGLSSFGTSDTVQLIDVTAGQHVEIIVRHAATTVVLRQSGRFFSISVRVPDDLVQKSLGSVGTQLCVMKCPAAERLSLSAIESLSTFAFADALNICRRHKLVDFFLDACVFDLVASGGDRNFTSAAVHALHDFRRLVPINASHLRSWTAFPGPNVSSCTVRLLSLKSLDYLLALFAIISLYLYWTVSLLLFSQMGCSCRSVTSHCATHPMSR
jgi:hypothetical protein